MKLYAQKHWREVADAVRADIEPCGLTMHPEFGRKHMKLWVQRSDGERRCMIVASSPRSDNHVDLARQRVRRIIQQLGDTRKSLKTRPLKE